MTLVIITSLVIALFAYWLGYVMGGRGAAETRKSLDGLNAAFLALDTQRVDLMGQLTALKTVRDAAVAQFAEERRRRVNLAARLDELGAKLKAEKADG